MKLIIRFLSIVIPLVTYGTWSYFSVKKIKKELKYYMDKHKYNFWYSLGSALEDVFGWSIVTILLSLFFLIEIVTWAWS